METETKSAKKEHYILIYLGEETFAINVKYVLRVLAATSFTKVPRGPDFLKGVTNFNGSVLPVVDTYRKFQFLQKEKPKGSHPLILVLNLEAGGKKTNLGLLVDDSNNVFEVSDKEIKPYPATGNKFDVEYIDGVIERNGKFILMLNPEKLFAQEALFDYEGKGWAGENQPDSGK
jgi:purine-binding chemotaxis protein CheW